MAKNHNLFYVKSRSITRNVCRLHNFPQNKIISICFFNVFSCTVVGAGSKDFGESQLCVMVNQTSVAGVDHLAPTRSFVTSEARDRGELTEYSNQDWGTPE
ncbi:hypothetical protein J6590_047366 [Homalodisca vitripennis]|nr:hypothetical protein J6590_047366 [Homalodisca vitripennis]